MTPPPARRRWAAFVLVAVSVLTSACRLELDVNVEVAADGSGAVEVVVGLDADAVDKVGGDVAAVLEVDDLTAAGWEVDGPVEESDGYTRVRIRHPFATPSEADAIFEQIAGEDGPFQGFHIERRTPFAATTTEFTGRVDFSGGIEAFGDSGLAAQLDGEPIGQSVEEIEAQLGESLSRLVQVRVRVRLPGEVTSNATTKADNGAVWQVGFGEGAVDLQATGEERHLLPVVLVGAAGVFGFALLLVLLVRVAMRRTAADPDR